MRQISSVLLVCVVLLAGQLSAEPAETTPKDTLPNVPAGYVLIPAGLFKMGSPSSEAGRFEDETQHDVEITRSFFLKETEVTQAEWKALMGNNPSRFSSCGGNCPVEKASWYDALAYCNALSKEEGLSTCYDLSKCTGTPGTEGYTCPDNLDFDLSCTGYRLPTEAEWEYAYRAGTTTAFYNGGISNTEGKDANLETIGWYDKNSDSSTHPAKGKAPNALGLYDMSGNIYEWTWDQYGDYPSTRQRDPKGASSGSFRVLRGGSWYDVARVARAAIRYVVSPDYRVRIVGFRPARSNH